MVQVERVGIRAKRISDSEIDSYVTATIPGNQENVRRPLSPSGRNLFAVRDTGRSEQFCPFVPERIVTTRLAILMARHEVIAERVTSFETGRASKV